MATRRAQPDEPSGWLFGVLEKHGLPVFILLVCGWWLAEQVGKPLVASTTTFMADLRDVNIQMERAYLDGQEENLQRWQQVWELLGVKKQLVERALDKITELEMAFDRMERSNEDVAKELAELKMLLIRSPVDDLKNAADPTNPQSYSTRP